ncbi:MAG: hypothetical protein PVG13_04770 [Thiohalophilus sp.]|jgi:hypothetical protein
MQSLLILEVDGESVFEYDRNTRLPGPQRDFLSKMDEDMDQGIRLAEQEIPSPDALQRARYVALHLLHAFQNDDQPMIDATCAYLVQRLPELNTVRVEQNNDQFHLELIMDR